MTVPSVVSLSVVRRRPALLPVLPLLLLSDRNRKALGLVEDDWELDVRWRLRRRCLLLLLDAEFGVSLGFVFVAVAIPPAAPANKPTLTALGVDVGSTRCLSIVKQGSAVGPGEGQAGMVSQMCNAPIRHASGLIEAGVVILLA